MILEKVCENLDILSIMVYIKKVVAIIEVAGPIIVIIMGGIDVLRAVTARDQEGIQKSIKMFPQRLFICAVLLLMPVIMTFIINTVDIKNNLGDCYANATPAHIDSEYERIALEAVKDAEREETIITYNYAMKCVSKVKNEDLRKSFNDRLKAVKKKIDEKNKYTFPTLENNPGGGSASGGGNEIVKYAEQFLGVPYIYGGNSLVTGVDCSGLVQQVYLHFGIQLPRVAHAQATCDIGEPINGLENAKPGDLLFYGTPAEYYHVAIYAGNGTRIHASGDVPCPTPSLLCKVVEDQRSMNQVAFIRRIIN